MPGDALHFVVTLFVCVISSVVAIYYVGMTDGERNRLLTFLLSKIRK